jgi:two-component system response regulator HydG
MEKQTHPTLKAGEISYTDFLDFNDETKVLRFNARRYIMADAAFLGILHQELIRSLGWRRSRAMLLRLGFASGYIDCQNLRKEYSWTDEKDLLRAGTEFQSSLGLARTRLTRLESDRASGSLLLEGAWEDSLESSWHGKFFGSAPAPVCWLLSGYMSGFATAWWGGEVLVREVECAATGRSSGCRFTGKPAKDWGEEGREDLGLLQVPDVGKHLAAIFEEPAGPGNPEGAEAAEGLGGVFRTARGAGIVGRSKALERALRLALQVAGTDATVLLVGESGTGKELFARLIHGNSPRAKAPFLAVNCSALPEPLLESELFGHKKGSFTGAIESRKGLFVAAERGTIFLDEIAEIPPAMQVKLLRVLQEREVRPVGETQGTRVDVRIVAATNRDLDRMISEGTFREDLYYRLKVFPIEVPPLRRRKEDIVPLSRHFLAKFSRSTGKKVNTLEPEVLRRLTAHRWPGNVRELENVLERAVVLAAGDRVTEAELPLEIAAAGTAAEETGEASTSLQEVERRHILRVLETEKGHRGRAAKALGIGVNTLWRKLKEYGIGAGERR